MKLIKLISVFAVGILLSTGCVKKLGYNLAQQSSPSPNTVDFPNQSEAAALDIVDTPTTYTFYVEANSENNNLPPTTVTIQKDTALVSAAGFAFLPDSAYQLVSTTSTVDPKTYLAPFQLKVNTSKIDLTQSFAVGYDLVSTSAGTIASNKNTTVISVGAKNQYDGVYTLDINTIGWGAYGIADNQPGTYPFAAQIITAGPNTDIINIPLGLGTLQPALTSTLGATGFGATTPLYTFDNSSNTLTAVFNTTPNDGRDRELAINPTPSTPGSTLPAGATWNTFDPVTHNIYMAYEMTQTGRPTQYIYQVLTYTGPR